MSRTLKLNPRKSLRWILALWFLIFAIVPIVFLTIYSLRKFQQTVDNELVLRLKGNSSEIRVILGEYQRALVQQQNQLLKDKYFQNLLRNQSNVQDSNRKNLYSHIREWLLNSSGSGISVYNRTGAMITHFYKFESQKKIEKVSSDRGIKSISLSESLKKQLETKSMILIPDYSSSQELILSIISPVINHQSIIGYLKLNLNLDAQFLKRLSERMQIQSVLLEPNGRIIIGSLVDFSLYKSEFFTDYLKIPKIKTISLNLRGEPFGFVFAKIPWGENQFDIALAASKKESNLAIDNLRIAYYTLLAIMFGVLALSVVAASNVVLRPLSELVEAIQDLHLGENIIELPLKNDNEIGQLTNSFNDLSRRILSAQRDLKDKITELEEANNHLKETQGQLVHSAKMASLGQLVAGVAHELNNPIGFIYSNMSHLREYSESLLKLVDLAEKDSVEIKKLKDEIDLDYIRKDMPKLITSCEEGARRTREIVLGLRNFSRVEEKEYRPFNLHQSLDTTLNLLNSEFKGRIEVKKNYEDIPEVVCNQTQINQVFMNILSNAAQSIEGPGTVWISTHFNEGFNSNSNAVTQSNSNGESYVKTVSVAIQDSGAGIPPEYLEKIFDPFFTTKAVGQGTGLGLAISYGIVHSHGGTIRVTSKMGKGTEFVIILPVDTKN